MRNLWPLYQSKSNGKSFVLAQVMSSLNSFDNEENVFVEITACLGATLELTVVY